MALCRHHLVALPTLQPLLRAAARALNRATIVLHPMLPARPAPAGSSASCHECAALLIFLQLCALALPAIHKARQEVRLFELHQWQRVERGLQPERGYHARVYAAAAALPPPSSTDALWATPLLIVLWHAALALERYIAML